MERAMHGTTAPAKDALLLFLLWARSANARFRILKSLLRGNGCNQDLTSTTGAAQLGIRERTIKTAMLLHSGIGSGSLAGVLPDSLVPAAVTIPLLAVQMRSPECNRIIRGRPFWSRFSSFA